MRFARDKSAAWMERLYALVAALPHHSNGQALPEVMAAAAARV